MITKGIPEGKSMIEPGDTVRLKDDRDFRATVDAISGWGLAFLQVINWSHQVGGFRGRDGVLSRTAYPATQLEKVDEEGVLNV